MDRSEADREFGKIAVDQGFLTLIDLEDALSRTSEDKSLVEVLTSEAKISREQIAKVVAVQRGVELEDDEEPEENQPQRRDSEFLGIDAKNPEDLEKFAKEIFQPGNKQKDILASIVLNFVWPGAGYFYLKKFSKGIACTVAVLLLFWTVIVPFAILIYSCVDCYKIASNNNQ
ncbi:MAG: hypothetical protein ACQETH_15705 [Candidatus Rifleibacteriota bacterium]